MPLLTEWTHLNLNLPVVVLSLRLRGNSIFALSLVLNKATASLLHVLPTNITVYLSLNRAAVSAVAVRMLDSLSRGTGLLSLIHI